MINSNVLFANDDVLTQWVMADVLVGAGFNVTSACRGRQIVEVLQDSPDFDILVIALDLPEFANGFEADHHWRQALPGRPIIFTGPHRGALARPLYAGESFLSTPFSAAQLLRAIDSGIEDACFQPVLPSSVGHIHHVH